MNSTGTPSDMMVGLDSWALFLRSFAMLALVLAVLLGTFWVVRRLTTGRQDARGKNLMTMLSSFYVAPKERLVLMDVMGRKILLGITPQNISCLAVIDESGAVKDVPAPGSFGGVLKETMNSESGNVAGDVGTPSGGNEVTENGRDE